jgi:isopentenyl diphosphate isomerase/L-lactate dehydrogenase-like FMN-dependent dehydrogenase
VSAGRDHFATELAWYGAAQRLASTRAAVPMLKQIADAVGDQGEVALDGGAAGGPHPAAALHPGRESSAR